ncbi:hypothetical protein EYF80_014624 [Liparis tanakae]|uniref:Uncharacterized protein n=1 Tax=Liparis tanakae TaxID=230148 RepID=A0A4Z2ICX0_9TELE|nr:hypothetical protein EYF80_014624 [Liparis tanakae]
MSSGLRTGSREETEAEDEMKTERERARERAREQQGRPKARGVHPHFSWLRCDESEAPLEREAAAGLPSQFSRSLDLLRVAHRTQNLQEGLPFFYYAGSPVGSEECAKQAQIGTPLSSSQFRGRRAAYADRWLIDKEDTKTSSSQSQESIESDCGHSASLYQQASPNIIWLLGGRTDQNLFL